MSNAFLVMFLVMLPYEGMDMFLKYRRRETSFILVMSFGHADGVNRLESPSVP